MGGTTGGTGHFVSWDGGCLVIGRAHGTVPVHSHYAIQISFGNVPGIRFRPNDAEEWTEYTAAIIASRQPHSMDASCVPYNVVLFIEPETREGRALRERYLQTGIAALGSEALEDSVANIFAAWQHDRTQEAVTAAARRLVRRLTGDVVPFVVSDERVLRAMTYIKSHLERSLTLEEVANEACLSPSRFRHLFVEETGMALRPYILWRRFLRVWELLMEGASLSTAAHYAGFADAAHLSRTSRQVFGFPPSGLQLSGLTQRSDAPEERSAEPVERAPLQIGTRVSRR